VSVRIYVEGGFQGSTKSTCRQAFRAFFGKTVPRGTFTVIASGSRSNAFEDFGSSLKQNRGDYNILLVDSEEAVAGGPWQHLASRQGDGWQPPVGATPDQAHLMVQVMEAWFLADRKALADYYGQGFTAGSLPDQRNVELISKRDVLSALKQASKNTKTKGEYHKTKHGFDLLELIDPVLVRAASVHADRLFVVLQRQTAA
jgi:Domain of unknown function (DUF4276)